MKITKAENAKFYNYAIKHDIFIFWERLLFRYDQYSDNGSIITNNPTISHDTVYMFKHMCKALVIQMSSSFLI